MIDPSWILMFLVLFGNVSMLLGVWKVPTLTARRCEKIDRAFSGCSSWQKRRHSENLTLGRVQVCPGLVFVEWQNGGVVYSDCETRPGMFGCVSKRSLVYLGVSKTGWNLTRFRVWNSSGQQPTVDRAWWKSDPVPLRQSGKPAYADMWAENVFADSSRSNLCAWFAVANVAVENCLQFCLSWWIEEFWVLFEAVYPYPIDHPLDSFSMVDFDAPDLQRLSPGSWVMWSRQRQCVIQCKHRRLIWGFDRFAHLKPFEVTLEPGDLLYLPKYWWHQVAQGAAFAHFTALSKNWNAQTEVLWEKRRQNLVCSHQLEVGAVSL